jgi:hypothetical protein
MTTYVVEIFGADNAILSRGVEEAPDLSREELFAFAREAVEKFWIVWGPTTDVAPTPAYVRILRDDDEMLRVSVWHETRLQ